jgi:hypothetical protein
MEFLPIMKSKEHSMKSRLFVALVTALITASAAADLKPDLLDCNPKKAARNAALDATVGVSGKCNASKAAENAKEDVVEGAKDAVDINLDGAGPLSDNDKKKHLPGKNKD